MLERSKSGVETRELGKFFWQIGESRKTALLVDMYEGAN